MGDYTPIFTPGKSVSATTSAAVTGGQLLAVSGTGTVGPAGAASAAAVGVAAQDAISGARVTYYTGGVQELVAAANVTAGQTLETAAAGQVTPHTNGANDSNIVGIALTTAASGAKVRVQMTH